MTAADREGDEATPRVQREIENNLLLKQAIVEIRSMKGTMDSNHLVAIELRDKKTIARVDTMWGVLTNVRWLAAAIATVLAALWASHSIWGKP